MSLQRESFIDLFSLVKELKVTPYMGDHAVQKALKAAYERGLEAAARLVEANERMPTSAQRRLAAEIRRLKHREE